MTPVIQFEPASLTIWTSTGSLDEPAAGLCREALLAAAQGGEPMDALQGLDEADPLWPRLLWLASCVWHEKRHFFDTCLTNYGALRFRNLFTLSVNLMTQLGPLADAGSELWLPVEVNTCPIRRRVLGIAEPSPGLAQLARHARDMKQYMARMDAPPGLGAQVIHVGAEAQMEGLAQASQMHVIEYRYGAEQVLHITREQVTHLPKEGPYRAIESVAGALGCTRELSAGVVVARPNLAAALFVTALCTRQFGHASKQAPPELVSPWPRLACLMEALGPTPGRFDMGDEEAMALVDATAKRLWGRTALDEIEADIEHAEQKVSMHTWLDKLPLGKVYAEFSALRRSLLAEARRLGPASLLPAAFPPQWVDRLRPWHVIATPGAVPAGSMPGVIAHGRQLNLPAGAEKVFPQVISWATVCKPDPQESSASFAVRDVAWNEMLELHGPMARLMLSGRRDRVMLPPALSRSVEFIENSGVTLKFDPRFAAPQPRDQTTCKAEALALAQFSGRQSFVCDVTGESIAPEQAAVLTADEFRASPLLQQVDDGSIGAQYLLATNWSDWIVKSDLVN